MIRKKKPSIKRDIYIYIYIFPIYDKKNKNTFVFNIFMVHQYVRPKVISKNLSIVFKILFKKLID